MRLNVVKSKLGFSMYALALNFDTISMKHVFKMRFIIIMIKYVYSTCFPIIFFELFDSHIIGNETNYTAFSRLSNKQPNPATYGTGGSDIWSFVLHIFARHNMHYY